MKKYTLPALWLTLILGFLFPNAYGQDSIPKLILAPTGRILMDAALYASPQKELFKDGASLPDVRLGARMSYGKWKANVDIGFAYNKVGLLDLFIEYNFNTHNLIRIGNFIHQFGLQSTTSSSMKPTMEEPVSNAIFNDPRQLGIMYRHSAEKWLAAASAHFEPKASTLMLTPTQFTQEGYGLRSRLAFRPVHRPGLTLQAGISGAFSTPQNSQDKNGNDTHDKFRFAANYPTRVAQVTALDATVSYAKNLFKFSPELLLNIGPVALESQYYRVRANRRYNLQHFTGQGAYATLRGLIAGGLYNYSMGDGGLATPKPKSLEVVGSYNWTSVTDAKAAVRGGRLNDASITFNYYINRYIITRLHYSYTHTWANDRGVVSVNGVMARLQVIF